MGKQRRVAVLLTALATRPHTGWGAAPAPPRHDAAVEACPSPPGPADKIALGRNPRVGAGAPRRRARRRRRRHRPRAQGIGAGPVRGGLRPSPSPWSGRIPRHGCSAIVGQVAPVLRSHARDRAAAPDHGVAGVVGDGRRRPAPTRPLVGRASSPRSGTEHLRDLPRYLARSPSGWLEPQPIRPGSAAHARVDRVERLRRSARLPDLARPGRRRRPRRRVDDRGNCG